jgi:integrase
VIQIEHLLLSASCRALRVATNRTLNGRVRIERGIVAQKVDATKTSESRKDLVVAAELLESLKTWKQRSQFPTLEDWIFASPFQIGRLPWSYDQVWRAYQRAARRAGLGRIGTHSLRHTFRTWLGSTGTPIGVQQRLMRHADVRMTMQYGTVFAPELTEATTKLWISPSTARDRHET